MVPMNRFFQGFKEDSTVLDDQALTFVLGLRLKMTFELYTHPLHAFWRLFVLEEAESTSGKGPVFQLRRFCTGM